MDDFIDLSIFVDIYSILYQKDEGCTEITKKMIMQKYQENFELMEGYEIPLDLLPKNGYFEMGRYTYGFY